MTLADARAAVALRRLQLRDLDRQRRRTKKALQEAMRSLAHIGRATKALRSFERSLRKRAS